MNHIILTLFVLAGLTTAARGYRMLKKKASDPYLPALDIASITLWLSIFVMVGMYWLGNIHHH
jgi:hypothetical protein